jgi:N-acyl-D-aspartate/D-glutamate deacylase
MSLGQEAQEGVGQVDTLIRNALLFDGSGSFPVYRDVAVAGGKVVAILSVDSGMSADDVVDATGLWLMPGLFDIHTHLDLEVEVNPGLGEAVRHGTTSVVVGNCSLGTAFGSQREGDADPIVDCFARVESMPKRILSACVEKITWKDTAGYLEHFSDIPLGPNVVPLIPHSMLRVEVMGLQDSVSRKANPTEQAEMKNKLELAMDQGYLGMSLDSLAFHYLANDPNKEKRVPTQYADRDEIFPLIEVLREKDRIMQTTPDNDDTLNSIKRLFWSCGRLYKKPLRVSALVAIDFNPLPAVYKIMLRLARLINSKFLQGHFHFQVLPTNFRMWTNGVESPVFEELPSTRQLLACEVDDRESRLKLLNDPSWEKEFRADMDRVTPKKGLKKLLAGRPPTFRLIPEEMNLDETPVTSWNGDTMADVLARLKIFQDSGGKEGAKDKEEQDAFSKAPNNCHSLVDFFLHCLKEYDLDFRWWLDLANCRSDVVKEMLFDENTLPGFNDSGAHITNMAFYDGNLVTLKIAQTDCLERVAEAVKRLSRDPAEFFGVDAGEICEGCRADLVLINPEELKKYDTNANREYLYVDHYQARCMVNRSDGVVEQVYINGNRAWQDGSSFTNEFGHQSMGRVLRFSRPG